MTDKQQLPASAARLAQAKDALRRAFLSGDGAAGYPFELARLFDAYFKQRLDEFSASGRPGPAKPFALAAVGGYGRGELCPYSDIDVLVLLSAGETADPGELARFLFFPLWDLGCDLGHGVRDIADCLAYSAKDNKVLASLLDARLVAGDQALFGEFGGMLASEPFLELCRGFGAFLARTNAERTARRGDAGALLEPDIKDGLGGLRDTHQILWLLKIEDLLGGSSCRKREAFPEEYAALLDHAAFLTYVRNHLHFLSGRKNDTVVFDFQRELATRLRYREGDNILAVERFLAELHRRMAEVKTLNALFYSHIGDERICSPDAAAPTDISPDFAASPAGLDFAGSREPPPDPLRLLLLFEEARKTGLPLSWAARRRVTALAGESSGVLSVSAWAFEHFTRLLAADPAGPVLEQMLETGLIGAIFPEFAQVQDMVQFDAYHIHPVGWHSLEAVKALGELARDEVPKYSRLYAGLARPETLLLAALFHDIGKGRGGNHAEVGAGLVETMLARFGAAGDLIKDVAHLVRYHLLLPDTATRRDLTDESEVIRCAALIGDAQRLTMLELLTYADSKATGPSAWTSWKAGLLSELASKVDSLMRGGQAAGTRAAQVMLRRRDEVRAKAKGLFDPAVVEARLDQMSPRYLAGVEAKDIVRHLALAEKLAKPGELPGPGRVVFDFPGVQAGRGAHFTVMARNDPALFATVAGALALHDVNILAADLYRWRDGLMVLILRVSEPKDAHFAHELWERVAKAITGSMAGKLALDYRLAHKRRSPLAPVSFKGLERPAAVLVDNDISDFYTAVEVRADDRVGLLYDIAHALFALKLDVHIAKVTTLGNRVSDVFYVRDLDGQKIDDPEQVKEIKEAIAFRLGNAPAR
ncbi:MAG: [protein-PII] uridylyltransferase [Desulfovibrionaceae bacterium]|nr:[protein-PII] uridylyltransferase [Desulfovibrionaceae bacterium]MBF0512712.1 [protein-PII] uridylyltransferase [Desulfovibrionaceae bacterium]